jgi:aldose 1-epimerase
MDLLTIRNENLKAAICPEIGASIHSLQYNLNGQWVDIMRPTPQEAVVNKQPGLFSAFHLLPYSNRIENGVLNYNGKVYKLHVNNTDGHTIHGVARDLPWKVVSANKEEMQLSFDSRDFEDVNWPWPFSSKLVFTIKDNLFTMSISIKNEGDETMPAGFGSHPYFSKQLTDKDEKIMVKLPLKGLYPGDTPIPTGKWIPVPEELDFSTERAMDESVFVDNCFRASEGSTTVRWLGSGVTMTMDADPIYENIIFYTPLGQPFFAIEPVTNCNNAFNMAEKGIDDTGAIYLQPGEEASGDIRITIEEK